MSKSVLVFAFFIAMLNLPSLVFADGMFSVSALGLNIGRDAAQKKQKTAGDNKDVSSKGETLSSDKKASKASSTVTKIEKLRERGVGALGFRKPKNKKENKQVLIGSPEAESVTVNGSTPQRIPLPSAQPADDTSLSPSLSLEKPFEPTAAGKVVVKEVVAVEVFEKNTFSKGVFDGGFQGLAKSIVAINRRKEPQFISKALALSASSNTSLAKLSYSWYFGNMYAALSYRSKSVSDDIFTMISGELRANEMTKFDEQVRVYPVNWLARFSRLQMSYGLFYSRRNFFQNEKGEGSVSFDNETTLSAEQYGLQTSFLYRTRSFRFRGFAHVPVTSVAVDESYYFDDGDTVRAKRSSVNSTENIAYELSMDVIVKTPWGFSLLASGAYEALPLEYEKIRASQDIDNQIVFSFIDYKAENRNIDLSFSVLLDALDIGNISPYVAVNFNRDTRLDKTKSTSLTTDSLGMLIGFSSQF